MAQDGDANDTDADLSAVNETEDVVAKSVRLTGWFSVGKGI